MLAVLLLALLAVGWVVFCLVDLSQATEVRYLPKWVWAILICGVGLGIPVGGILYLTIGKVRHPSRPVQTGKPQWRTRSGWPLDSDGGAHAP